MRRKKKAKLFIFFKKTLLMIAFLTFFGCCNNDFYFDLENQSIISCCDKPILNIRIKGINNRLRYSINWNSKVNNNKPPNRISLNHIDEGYEIFLMNEKVENKKFKLLPNSKYEIKRYQGDTPSVKIFITTNEFSKISETSNVTCR